MKLTTTHCFHRHKEKQYEFYCKLKKVLKMYTIKMLLWNKFTEEKNPTAFLKCLNCIVTRVWFHGIICRIIYIIMIYSPYGTLNFIYIYIFFYIYGLKCLRFSFKCDKFSSYCNVLLLLMNPICYMFFFFLTLW